MREQSDALEELYRERCTTASDINEHLPVLRALAEECRHVTELGTRAGNSTAAFLAAKPAKLVCLDIARYQQVDELAKVANGTEFVFRRENTLKADLEETDLLFIDTWHTYDQLRGELDRHAGKARKYIVLHDTVTFGEKGEDGHFRGLHQAVKEFVEGRQTFRTRKHYENNNGLTVLERIRPESEGKPVVRDEGGAMVFLGLPFYQDVVGQMIDGLDNAVGPSGGNAYAKWFAGSSAHCRNFNDLWCGALNSRHYGWTHFAMVHADVQPRGFWLDAMLREQRRAGADLLSVVLPIKTHQGLTSTALRRKSDGLLRRLTMKELWSEKMPDTFDGPAAASALGWEGEWELLASSGLWLCDFTKPWVELVYFSDADRIVKCEDGQFKAAWVSEDWAFSSMLLSAGLKVAATRAVSALHWGRTNFKNDGPWGASEQDAEACAFGKWYEWPTAGEAPVRAPATPESTLLRSD